MNGIKNADMKSWMSSAFGDIADDKKTKPATVTKRTARAVASSSSAAKNSFPVDNSKKIKLLLTEKYQPNSRSELIVNKAKVDQLSNLLDSAIEKKNGSIIIIEGPPGCGKTTTLNILCKEKNIDIVPWNQPNTILKNFDKNNDLMTEENDWQSNPYESQSKMFSNFLFKSSRYVADQIFSSEADIRMNKILLLKDIPIFAFKDVRGFQQLLLNFMKYSKFPLVFTLSNSPNISNELNPAKIFKPDLRKDLKSLDITFNPIANTFVQKHLERIIKSESTFNSAILDKNYLSEICLTCDGDLRQALNILELSQNNPKALNQPQTSKEIIKKPTASKGKVTSKQKVTTRQEHSDNYLIQKKDANFSIFRGLGKVLHRKNMEPAIGVNDKYFETENKLHDFLKSKNLYRKPLFYDPDDILLKTPISEELITLYLHQNYLDLFALKSDDKTFDEKFEALEQINENFMISDQMNRVMNSVDRSASIAGDKCKEVTALLSIRSILFNTYSSGDKPQNTQKSSLPGKSLWRPLHKPYSYKMLELQRKKRSNVHDMLLDNNDPQNIQLATYLIEMESEFFTTILPYATMKKNRKFKELASVTNGLGSCGFKQNQTSLLLSNENDPSFFMDEESSGDYQRMKRDVGKSTNAYDYEDTDSLDICD